MLSVEFILPKPDASENYEWQKKKKIDWEKAMEDYQGSERY